MNVDTIGELNEQTLNDYIELAEKKSQLKEYAKAGEILEKVLTEFPNEGKALYCMGNVCVAFNQPEQAYKNFYAALDNGYVNFRSLLGAAMIEKSRGNKEQVVELLQRALDLDFKNPIAMQLLLSELFEQKKMRRAILLALDLQALCPKLYEAYHSEISAWIALEEYEQAFEKLQEISSAFSENNNFILDYVLVLFLKKEYQSAWDYLCTNSNFVNTKSLEYLRLKSKIVCAMEMKEEAYETLEKIYENYHMIDAALNLAILLIADDRVDEAVTYLTQIIDSGRKCRDYYTALYMYAQCQNLLGKSDVEIQQAYKNAIDTYEDVYNRKKNVYLMELAAACYQAIGDGENETRCRAEVEKYQEMNQ